MYSVTDMKDMKIEIGVWKRRAECLAAKIAVLEKAATLVIEEESDGPISERDEACGYFAPAWSLGMNALSDAMSISPIEALKERDEMLVRTALIFCHEQAYNFNSKSWSKEVLDRDTSIIITNIRDSDD